VAMPQTLYLTPALAMSICVPSCVDVVALTGCARSSLGICASSSGAIAGCLIWQVAWYYSLYGIGTEYTL